MNEVYQSVRSSSTAQIKIEGSRFIADVFPVSDEEEAKANLERVRKKYFDATHHCFAYVIGAERTIVRYSDDGEPSGTAGVKIYSAVHSRNLSDILLIVTRYFGGTKLGVGGLGRAYFQAAVNGIDSAEIIRKALMRVVEIKFGFNDTNAVMNAIHSNKFKVTYTEYTQEKSILRVCVPPALYEKFNSALTEATRARAEIIAAGEQTIIL